MVKHTVKIEFEIDIPAEVVADALTHEWVFQKLGEDLTSCVSEDSIALFPVSDNVRKQSPIHGKSYKIQDRVEMMNTTIQTRLYDFHRSGLLTPTVNNTDHAFFVWSGDSPKQVGVLVRETDVRVVMVDRDHFVDLIENFIDDIRHVGKEPPDV